MGKKQDTEVPDTEEVLKHPKISLGWRKILCPPREDILSDHSVWPHSPRRSFRRLSPPQLTLSVHWCRCGVPGGVTGARGPHLCHALTAKLV